MSRARGSRAAPKTGNAFPERAAFYCNVIKESLALLAAGLLAVVGALWLSRPSSPPLIPRAPLCTCFFFLLVAVHLFRCNSSGSFHKAVGRVQVAAPRLCVVFPLLHGLSGAASQLELTC